MFLRSHIMVVLDVQLRLHDISKTPCEGIIEISPFLMFLNLPVLVELRVASLPDWRSVNSLHMHLTWNSTQLDSLRVSPVSYQEGEGEEVTGGDARLFMFFCRLGSTEGDSPSLQNVSHSHMQPKGLLD